MNRLLVIPGIVSCVGFVFLASAGSVETRENPSGGGSWIDSTETDARVLMGAEQIETALLDRWNHYNESKNSFSRVYRPSRYQTPSVLVNDDLPTPAGSFVGIISLQDGVLARLRMQQESLERVSSEYPKLEVPFVVDRETGEAIVFVAGKWTAFDQWAVNGE